MKKYNAHQMRITVNNQRKKYLSLGDYYRPASDAPSLSVNTPDSMSFDLHAAIDRLMENIGNIDDYVAIKLRYKTLNDLYASFSAEQIDALALSIYNIEDRGQGLIVGDQTGIGKGRIAAGLIRYAVMNSKMPIFITEKPNLFSDIYRDLKDIGSANIEPFILNAKEDKTNIKTESGEVLYSAPIKETQNRIIESGQVPGQYDLVMLTYSQLSGGGVDSRGVKRPEPPKLQFVKSIAEGAILIMDESHNAAGSSNTGQNLKEIVTLAEGVLFLSATFAKRPDNMPIYAMKTVMGETGLDDESLISAMQNGGVALQEIISSELVASGQLIRRERTFEGVEINYIVTDNLATIQRKKSDAVTEILRLIIQFQEEFILPEIEEMDSILAAENGAAEMRKGTGKARVDAQPFVSKIFNSINQLLFAIKTDAVIDRALMRLRQNKKVVIAFSSTMEAFVQDMVNQGLIGIGDDMNADFSVILNKALDGVLRYTVRDDAGQPTYKMFNIAELSEEARTFYKFILSKIATNSTDLVISPIDLIVQSLQSQGYRVGEVTGRQYSIDLRRSSKSWRGTLERRKKENISDLFNRFQNNELDVLLINQSGSTGASAHAIITKKVPRNDVKQRVMIVAQPELDINREVQKRGRVMRTGQIYLPIYDYIISAVPAEKRLSMMLQRKLKSLDANTTSNQKSSQQLMKSDDFLNKYGDKIVMEFLKEFPEFNTAIGEPYGKKSANSDGEGEDSGSTDKDGTPEGAAHKVSGRVAILSSEDQEKFYDEIIRRYSNYVEQLIESDEYDLEVEVMDLKSDTQSREVLSLNDSGGDSEFSGSVYLEKCTVNVLKKPWPVSDVQKKVMEELGRNDQSGYSKALIAEMKSTLVQRMAQLDKEEDQKTENKKRAIKNRKEYMKLKTDVARKEYIENAVQMLDEQLVAIKNKNREKYNNEFDTLSEFFEFFYPGRAVKIPVSFNSISEGNSFGVVWGFKFGSNKKNKFAPSNVSIKFFIANSRKQLTIDLTNSNLKNVYAIRGSSYYIQEQNFERVLQQYTEATKESNKDRNTRFIVTGNMLKFFGSEFMPKGRLIQYTTIDGIVKKGALMPESFNDKVSQGIFENVITVPVNIIRPVIDRLSRGRMLTLSNKSSIGLGWSGEYVLYVPKARQTAGHIYLNKDLLKLVNGNNFTSVSSNMKATFSYDTIDQALEIMSRDLKMSASLSQDQLDLVKASIGEETRKKREASSIRNNKPKPKTPYVKPEEQKKESASAAQAQRIRLIALKYKFSKK